MAAKRFDKKKLDKLSTKQREKHLKNIVEKAKKNLDFANVYCSQKDVSAIKKYKPQTKDILGGAILENKDKTVRVDLTYSTLLDKIKKENLMEISKILFS